MTQNQTQTPGSARAIEVTFSLYELQEGGPALWSELQKVELDEQGHYTVLLGSTQPEGLPLDLFTSGKARWLGVQPQRPGAVEQPRVLLVGMPYALKASDADTLGGKPASAYALASALPLTAAVPGGAPAQPDSRNQLPATDNQVPASSPQPLAPCSVTSNGTATPNYLPKFTSACNIQKSLIFDNGTEVGVGTNAPGAFLDAQSTVTATSASSNYGVRALTTAAPTAPSAASVFSLFANAQTPPGNTQNITGGLYAFDFRADHFGTGTLSGGYGGFGAVINHAAGTISNAYGLYTYLDNASTGKITNAYGLYLAPPLNPGGGTFSNYTGVYIANPSAVPGAFGLYSAGGKNYFGGNVGIGTPTPAANLEVNGTTKFDNTVTFAPGQTFTGDGSGLTNVNAAKLNGLMSSAFQPAGTYVTGATSGGGLVVSGTTLGIDQTNGGYLKSNFLELAGGTLTGGLSGTTGSFSGTLTAAGASLPGTGVATSTAGANSQPLDLTASSFLSTIATAVNERFRWQVEPAGNNTASPSGTLNLLFASGNAKPIETGLSIASNGRMTFAQGQMFPGTGTVTSVGSGAGLAGGPITASGTLSIATGGVTNAMLANPSLTVKAGTDLAGGGSAALGGSLTLSLDTTKVPTLGASSNIFTGTLSASSLGIGTTTPAATLEVNGTARFDQGIGTGGSVGINNLAPSFPLDIYSNPTSAETVRVLTGGTDAAISLNNIGNGGREYWIDSGASGAGVGAGNLTIWDNTALAARLAVNPSGYVGMGTTTPYTLLHLVQYNPGGLGPSLTLMNNGSGAGAGASVDFDGYDTAANPPTARIQSFDDGNYSSSLTFSTKVPGAANNSLAEQVRITDFGSLVVDSSSNNALALGGGSASGTGLLFGGPGSGEGIASCRASANACTDGGGSLHVYGLDFYTGYTRRCGLTASEIWWSRDVRFGKTGIDRGAACLTHASRRTSNHFRRFSNG